MSEVGLKLATCSVALDAHPARNVLSPEVYRCWQASAPIRPAPPLPPHAGGSHWGLTRAGLLALVCLQFKGTDRGSITLQLAPPSPIWRLHVTNAGSQFVEVLGSRAEQGDDWEPIVSKATLRKPDEIKEGKARDRQRTFTNDSESLAQLSKQASETTWCRLKVTCSW